MRLTINRYNFSRFPTLCSQPRRNALTLGSLTLVLFLVGQNAIAAHSHTPRTLIAMTDQVRGMCQQAEQLINSQRFNDAIQLLNQANGIDPNCAEVHGYLGMAFQNSSNPAKAVGEYTRALQLNPGMSFINVNLGTCYMNLNQMDQAVPYFQTYLQQNPNAADAQQVRGYIQQSGARQGQQNLRQLVEQGQSLLQQKRFPEAKAAFEQAIVVQPTFAPAHFYMGFTLAQLGQHQPAIGEFEKCLQLDASVKEAVMNIASNYQSLGDCANAISWYERYLHENPGSPKTGDIRQRIHGLRQQMSEQGKAPQVAANPGTVYGAVPDDYLSNAMSGGKLFHWTHVPIRVYIASAAGVPGYRDSYNQILMDSFTAWAQASEHKLSFVLMQDPSQADIQCLWTGDPNAVFEAGRPVEGGLTKLSAQPISQGEAGITSARITVLTNRSGTPLTNDDMKKVCLHEVGHALGINGHSSNNADIMFFSESPSMWPALTKRDKATIRRLYSR